MRILGADIPDDKRVEIALTYVFGIGRTRAREILENTKIDFSKKSTGLDGVLERRSLRVERPTIS